MSHKRFLTTIIALTFAGTAFAGCLGGDTGDGNGGAGVPADAYSLTVTGLPDSVASGEQFNFTLEITGDETRTSQHIGAHYGTSSSDEPSTTVYDRACEHQQGDAPGTFTVTCTISDAGSYFLRGHLQFQQDGTTSNFWSDEHEMTVTGINVDVGDIVVGTDAAFPPFEVVNTETGEFEGFDIDVMREIGDRAGFSVTFQNIGFDVLIPSLQQGEIDAVISAMSITDAREEQVDFSIPYYEANQSVMMRADAGATYSSLDEMKEEGLAFGAQTGTVGADVIVEEFGEESLTRYDTYPLAVEALKRGDVDAVVMDAPAQHEAADGDAEVEVIFEFSIGDVYGIAVESGNTALLAAINTALASMFADGTMDELREKHGI